MKVDLLFLGDYWDSMWRRRQQLASRLARSGRFGHVLYVERPLSLTSLVKFQVGRADRDATDRWTRVFSNRSWLMRPEQRLSVLTTFALLPPVGAAAVFRMSESLRDRWLLSWIRHHLNVGPHTVCVSHPQMSSEVIRALKPQLLWYDCTEDFAAWPVFPACARGQILETDRWLTERADVVTTVSKILYEEKRRANANAYWLPNAVDTDLFVQKSAGGVPVPACLHAASRPVLAFVGALYEWAHDWDLLFQVAALRPEWTILLIGELTVSAQTHRALNSHPNIVCAGQRPYSELSAYLAHGDVCFQFYRPSRGNDTRNSQKLFLYFAAGKPVISTRSADVLAYTECVSLADGPVDFVAAVEEEMRTNSPAKIEKRQKIALASSWDRRVQEIDRILSSVRRS